MAFLVFCNGKNKCKHKNMRLLRFLRLVLLTIVENDDEDVTQQFMGPSLWLMRSGNGNVKRGDSKWSSDVLVSNFTRLWLWLVDDLLHHSFRALWPEWSSSRRAAAWIPEPDTSDSTVSSTATLLYTGQRHICFVNIFLPHANENCYCF